MTKILLVDDEKDVRDFTARFFEERNFEVLSATSGNDALLAIKKDRPDIVLLEMKMKDMSGIEILKHIRKVSRATKVIVVSCVNDVEIIDEARRSGIIAYLTKPVLLNELMDIVLKNIGKKRRFFKLKRAARNV